MTHTKCHLSLAASVATKILIWSFLNFFNTSKRFACVISPCKPSALYPLEIKALVNSSTQHFVASRIRLLIQVDEHLGNL